MDFPALTTSRIKASLEGKDLAYREEEDAIFIDFPSLFFALRINESTLDSNAYWRREAVDELDRVMCDITANNLNMKFAFVRATPCHFDDYSTIKFFASAPIIDGFTDEQLDELLDLILITSLKAAKPLAEAFPHLDPDDEEDEDEGEE